MLVTDWADINNLFQREHVAKDKKDAIRLAINAGIDMSMDPYSVDFCILLKELVQEGKVPMSRIDDAVRRILRLKYRLGLFDEPNTGGKGYEKFGSDEFAQKSLRAAEESIVLLKNEGSILPLAPASQQKKILLTGPNANQMRCLHGGWRLHAQRSSAHEVDIVGVVGIEVGHDVCSLGHVDGHVHLESVQHGALDDDLCGVAEVGELDQFLQVVVGGQGRVAQYVAHVCRAQHFQSSAHGKVVDGSTHGGEDVDEGLAVGDALGVLLGSDDLEVASPRYHTSAGERAS